MLPYSPRWLSEGRLLCTFQRRFSGFAVRSLRDLAIQILQEPLGGDQCPGRRSQLRFRRWKSVTILLAKLFRRSPIYLGFGFLGPCECLSGVVNNRPLLPLLHPPRLAAEYVLALLVARVYGNDGSRALGRWSLNLSHWQEGSVDLLVRALAKLHPRVVHLPVTPETLKQRRLGGGGKR